MNTILFTALLVAVAATGAYSQACHMREVDLCMAIGMFHYQSNGVPSDEERVSEWCETMKEVEDCMGNFSSKCLSPLQREIIGLMSGAEGGAKQLCVEGSEMRASYLSYAECLSEGAESDEFKVHMKDLQVMIEELFEVPFDQRFSLLCCGFSRFHYNSEEMTRRRCGEGAVEMIKSIIKMITTEMPSTLCQQFDSQGDECQNILPPSGSKSKGGEKSQLSKLLDTVFGEN